MTAEHDGEYNERRETSLLRRHQSTSSDVPQIAWEPPRPVLTFAIYGRPFRIPIGETYSDRVVLPSEVDELRTGVAGLPETPETSSDTPTSPMGWPTHHPVSIGETD